MKLTLVLLSQRKSINAACHLMSDKTSLVTCRRWRRQESSSHQTAPGGSPVVLVCKKDGSHRFCVAYRGLNDVTKSDTFPLHPIDDLLDHLAGARFFSTLDLASVFWKICVHPDSQKKTSFVTLHGLYEFHVMLFSLKNAPAAFQQFMQQVVADLNLVE